MLFGYELTNVDTGEVALCFIHHTEVKEYANESKHNPYISKPEKLRWRSYPAYIEGLNIAGKKYFTSVKARNYLRKKGIGGV